jgi:hypothetical protein
VQPSVVQPSASGTPRVEVLPKALGGQRAGVERSREPAPPVPVAEAPAADVPVGAAKNAHPAAIAQPPAPARGSNPWDLRDLEFE